jgi:hypothetical protein
MTPQTSLELHFGDGEYLFDLRLPQMAELQDKRGIGIFALYARILKGRYLFQGETIGATNEGEAYAEDLFETIRLGLIGGGRGLVDGKEIEVSPLLARKLVERYGWDAPLRDSWAVAAAVLAARIEGYSPPGEEGAGASPATPSPQSTSEKSSPIAEPSESTGAL